MYHFLVVDDELQIREGCAAYIREQFPQLAVYTAPNGRDALTLLQAQSIDAILLDIKMRNMDGLTMLGEMRRMGISALTVIMSGFSDFQFAQQAIALGVVRYLIKPFSPQDIQQVVGELIERIDRNRHREEMLENLRSRVRESTVQLRDEMFSAWISGRIEEQELYQKSEYLECSFAAPRYQAVVLRTEYDDDAENDARRLCVRQVVDELRIENVQTFLTHEGITLLYSLAAGESADYALVMGELAGAPLSMRVSAGVGSPQMGTDGIVTSYDQAVAALRDQGQSDGAAVFVWSPTLHERVTPIFDSVRFALALRLCDDEYVFRVTESMFALGETPSLEECETNCMMIVSSCRAALGEQCESEGGAYGYSKQAAAIERFRSVPEFCEYAMVMVRRCMDALSVRSTSSSKIVQRAHHLIETEYAKELTVRRLADECNVNSDYLGRMFKKQYGETISAFLNRVRIQNAIQLLQSTELNVGQIAEAVGFSDQGYFSTVFKRITGAAPSKYAR